MLTNFSKVTSSILFTYKDPITDSFMKFLKLLEETFWPAVFNGNILNNILLTIHILNIILLTIYKLTFSIIRSYIIGNLFYRKKR